jgi:hypothetical protein
MTLKNRSWLKIEVGLSTLCIQINLEGTCHPLDINVTFAMTTSLAYTNHRMHNLKTKT